MKTTHINNPNIPINTNRYQNAMLIEISRKTDLNEIKSTIEKYISDDLSKIDIFVAKRK